MNFYVSQFFTMGFFGVLAPNPEKKYEWMEDCQKLTGDDWCREATHVTPQRLRWTS